MKVEAFIEELAELLEADVSEMNESFDLHECQNWDSLSKVYTAALVTRSFGVTLDSEKIQGSRTVGELLRHIKEALANL